MADIRNQESQFAPYIKTILQDNIALLPKKCFSIWLSSEMEDTKMSFDLKFNANIEVSVRLRTHDKKYPDITIRSRSKYGGMTEITKLALGKGQIYFYGWLDEQQTKITHWILIDIDKIRDKLFTHYDGWHISNGDGTEFNTYTFKLLKESGAVIKKSTT